MNDKQYALAWEKESKQYNEKNKEFFRDNSVAGGDNATGLSL